MVKFQDDDCGTTDRDLTQQRQRRRLHLQRYYRQRFHVRQHSRRIPPHNSTPDRGPVYNDTANRDSTYDDTADTDFMYVGNPDEYPMYNSTADEDSTTDRDSVCDGTPDGCPSYNRPVGHRDSTINQTCPGVNKHSSTAPSILSVSLSPIVPPLLLFLNTSSTSRPSMDVYGAFSDPVPSGYLNRNS